MLSITETKTAWRPLSKNLLVPCDEAECEQLVRWLDRLIDEVGEDETHPLASLMEVLAVLIEHYEDQHIPDISRKSHI